MGAVVHAASAMLPNPPALIQRVNVEGTRNMLAFAERAGATRFVYLSAVSAVYARLNSYGRSKAEAERLVRESGLPHTILRPTMVYGPGGGLHFAKLVAVAEKIPLIFPVLGSGTARLQPVWIDDVVDAIMLVLDEPRAHGRTYNLSGATALPFRGCGRDPPGAAATPLAGPPAAVDLPAGRSRPRPGARSSLLSELRGPARPERGRHSRSWRADARLRVPPAHAPNRGSPICSARPRGRRGQRRSPVSTLRTTPPRHA